MAETFQVNYETLEDVQKRFSRLNEQVVELRQVLERADEPFWDGAWQGEGYDAFAEEFMTLQIGIKNLHNALTNAANTVGSIATTVRDAEQQAQSALNRAIQ